MCLTIDEFAVLFLAELAKRDYNNYANLYFDYKDRIKNLLCQDNDMHLRFSSIINLNDYYGNITEWENSLGNEIDNVIKGLKKGIHIDIQNDTLLIHFTDEEINTTQEFFNEEAIYIMDCFVSLISDYRTSRRYVEQNGFNNVIFNKYNEASTLYGKKNKDIQVLSLKKKNTEEEKFFIS